MSRRRHGRKRQSNCCHHHHRKKKGHPLIPTARDFAHLVPGKVEWEGLKTLVKPPAVKNDDGEYEPDRRSFLRRLSDRVFKGKV